VFIRCCLLSRLVVAVAAAFALTYRSQTGQRSPTITGKTARAARSARCSTQDRNGLVPNFTEERVKRFARILESNESLIDDLWQLAV
jgi:hypothetical protein